MRQSVLRPVVSTFVLVTGLLLGAPANAAVYLFTLSGPNTATFTLNSSPTPASTGSGFFTLQNVSGTYNGSPTTFAALTFFDALHDGGFSGGNLSLGGPQLFTGSLASPTFQLGTFALCDCNFGVPNYSLSIAAAPTVPEPASWAMMLLGFAGITIAVRKQPRLSHST